MNDEEQKNQAPTPMEIETVPVPEQVTSEEARRRMMQADFALGANTRHLRLPGGLKRTDR